MIFVGCWCGVLLMSSAPTRAEPAPTGPTVAVRVAPGPYFVGQGVGLSVTVQQGEGEPEPAVEPPRTAQADLLALGLAGDSTGAAKSPTRVYGFVLVPRRSGELTVGPFRVRAAEDRLATSKPTTITVRSVPQAGRTAAFLGGVGPCRVTGAVDPNQVRVGQPVEFRLTLSGPGAWGSTQAPDLAGWSSLPPAFEVRAVTSEVEPGDPPTRTFRYRLRPLKPGRAVLPPVTVATFDPASGRFQTRATASQPIEVDPPPRFDPAAIQFDPIPAASAGAGHWIIGLVAGTVGILVAMATGRSRRRRTDRPISWRQEAAELQRWARRQGPGLAVTNVIHDRLARCLGRATGQPLAVLTPREAAASVAVLTRDDALAARVSRLVAECDRLRFDQGAEANATVGDLGEVVAEAVAVMQAIGQSVRQSRPVGRSRQRTDPGRQGRSPS